MFQVTPAGTADVCIICDGKVYLIEKHIADGKLYHRSCFKRNNRKTDTSALIAPSKPTQPFTPTPTPTPTQPFTPTRPSVLSSNGLKKPATSLPATPNTPPADPRPEWQKRIQDKSSTPRGSKFSTPKSAVLMNRTISQPVLAPLREDNSRGQTTPELQNVRLRSKPSDAVAMPRAVSVGVDLDERIVKLRQLRASAKASSASSTAAPSSAVKARLERLQALVVTGKVLQSSGLAKNNDDAIDGTSNADSSSTQKSSPSAESEKSSNDKVSLAEGVNETKSDSQTGATMVTMATDTQSDPNKLDLHIKDTLTHSSDDLADDKPSLPEIKEELTDKTTVTRTEPKEADKSGNDSGDVESVKSLPSLTRVASDIVDTSTNPFEMDEEESPKAAVAAVSVQGKRDEHAVPQADVPCKLSAVPHSAPITST